MLKSPNSGSGGTSSANTTESARDARLAKRQADAADADAAAAAAAAAADAANAAAANANAAAAAAVDAADKEEEEENEEEEDDDGDDLPAASPPPPPNVPAPTLEDELARIGKLKVDQLRGELAERELLATGKKNVLVERLSEAIKADFSKADDFPPVMETNEGTNTAPPPPTLPLLLATLGSGGGGIMQLPHPPTVSPAHSALLRDHLSSLMGEYAVLNQFCKDTENSLKSTSTSINAALHSKDIDLSTKLTKLRVELLAQLSTANGMSSEAMLSIVRFRREFSSSENPLDAQREYRFRAFPITGIPISQRKLMLKVHAVLHFFLPWFNRSYLYFNHYYAGIIDITSELKAFFVMLEHATFRGDVLSDERLKSASYVLHFFFESFRKDNIDFTYIIVEHCLKWLFRLDCDENTDSIDERMEYIEGSYETQQLDWNQQVVDGSLVSSSQPSLLKLLASNPPRSVTRSYLVVQFLNIENRPLDTAVSFHCGAEVTYWIDGEETRYVIDSTYSENTLGFPCVHVRVAGDLVLFQDGSSTRDLQQKFPGNPLFVLLKRVECSVSDRSAYKLAVDSKDPSLLVPLLEPRHYWNDPDKLVVVLKTIIDSIDGESQILPPIVNAVKNLERLCDRLPYSSDFSFICHVSWLFGIIARKKKGNENCGLFNIPALLTRFLSRDIIQESLFGIHCVTEAMWYLAVGSDSNKVSFQEKGGPRMLQKVASLPLLQSQIDTDAMTNVQGAYEEITGEVFADLIRERSRPAHRVMGRKRARVLGKVGRQKKRNNSLQRLAREQLAKEEA